MTRVEILLLGVGGWIAGSFGIVGGFFAAAHLCARRRPSTEAPRATAETCPGYRGAMRPEARCENCKAPAAEHDLSPVVVAWLGDWSHVR